MILVLKLTSILPLVFLKTIFVHVVALGVVHAAVALHFLIAVTLNFAFHRSETRLAKSIEPPPARLACHLELNALFAPNFELHVI